MVTVTNRDDIKMKTELILYKIKMKFMSELYNGASFSQKIH